MKNIYAERRIIAARVGLVLLLIAAAGGPAFAQGGGTRPTPVDRRMEHMTRQGEQYERDKLNSDLKGGANNPRDRKRAEALAAQVRHDFEVLQAGYNRIVIAMASKKGLDYDSVLGAVAEIRKCSHRLKNNLALPRPKGDEDKEVQGEAIPERVEESLLMLRKHVYSFVTSPLFEAPAVLDVEQAKKASRDLDRVIELSESIGKSGDRLKKHTN